MTQNTNHKAQSVYILLYDISQVDSPLVNGKELYPICIHKLNPEVNIQYYACMADCRWIEVLQLGQYQEEILLLWLPLHLCE